EALSPWVREVSAAGGRYSEPDEGKVTSNQEGIYAVAECDDNFSGQSERVSLFSAAQFFIFQT
ncbi:MAG: hypothetical protein IIV99_02775, partial [Oscillospiraceae bacterium]|nr:hypothetical protein [Oscillospiraceae bacterium]